MQEDTIETRQEPIRAEKLPQVDLFKGIAIFMIVLTHSAHPFSLPIWATWLPRFGQMGCQIFLVLSAFTLCLSYERKRPRYLSFVKTRFLRLALEYWCVLLLNTLIAGISILATGENALGTDLNPKHILINALLLHGLVPAANNSVIRGGWFVGTIFLFYLLFPLLFRLYRSRLFGNHRHITFPLAFFVLGAGVMLFVGLVYPKQTIANNSFFYYSIVNQMPPLALGFSLFTLYRSEKTVKFPLWKGLVALTVSVALFFGGIPYAFAFVPFAFALGFFYFFLLSLRSSCQGKLARAVGRCGIISFEIYLLHMYIVYDVQKAWNSLLFSGQSQGLLAYVVWLPIAFALSLGIGFLFHLLFFSAQKKLKHLFQKKTPPQT